MPARCRCGPSVKSTGCWRTAGSSSPAIPAAKRPRWIDGVQREVEVFSRRMRRELQVEPLILCLVQPAPAGTPVYKGRADAEPDNRPAPRGRGGRHGGGGHGGGGRNAAAAGGGRNRDTAPVRVVKSPVATPASASTSVLSAPAPAAATTAVSAPAAASVDQEMPAGRTRRRRSAAV